MLQTYHPQNESRPRDPERLARKRLCPDQKSTSERAIPEYMRRLTPATQKDGVHEFYRNNVSKGGSTPDPFDD